MDDIVQAVLTGEWLPTKLGSSLPYLASVGISSRRAGQGIAGLVPIRLPAGWKVEPFKRHLISPVEIAVIDERERIRGRALIGWRYSDEPPTVYARFKLLPRFQMECDTFFEKEERIKCLVFDNSLLVRNDELIRPSTLHETASLPAGFATSLEGRLAQQTVQSLAERWLDRHHPTWRDLLRSWEG